jgi:hypothetical protein
LTESIEVKGETAVAKQKVVIEIRAFELPSAHEAIQHTEAAGWGKAVLLNGQNLSGSPVETLHS